MKYLSVLLFVLNFSCGFKDEKILDVDSFPKKENNNFNAFKAWISDSSRFYIEKLKLKNPNAYFYSEVSSDSSYCVNSLSFNKFYCIDKKVLQDEALINLLELLKINDFNIAFPFYITFEYVETFATSEMTSYGYEKNYVIDNLQIIKNAGNGKMQFDIFLNKGNLISVDTIYLPKSGAGR